MAFTGRATRHVAMAQPVHDPPVFALVHRDPVQAQPGGHGVDPVAFLDAQFPDALHHRISLRKSRHHRQDRILVDHARGARRVHLDTRQIGRKPGAQIGHRLAALFAFVFIGQVRAHFTQRGEQPGTGGVQPDIGHQNVRTGRDDRGAYRKRRRRGIARHGDGLRLQLGLTRQRDHPARIGIFGGDPRAKAPQHPLGMVARGLFFDHHGLSRRVQPRQQHRRFHLRRRHRHFIAHRHRIGRAHDGHRQPPARPAHGLRPEQRDRIRDPRHRALVQAGVAGKGGGDTGRGHRPHDQPHPGARIAAIDHVRRFGKTTHAHTVH